MPCRHGAFGTRNPLSEMRRLSGWLARAVLSATAPTVGRMLRPSMDMFGSIIRRFESLEESAVGKWDVCVRAGWVRWVRYGRQGLYAVADEFHHGC